MLQICIFSLKILKSFRCAWGRSATLPRHAGRRPAPSPTPCQSVEILIIAAPGLLLHRSYNSQQLSYQTYKQISTVMTVSLNQRCHYWVRYQQLRKWPRLPKTCVSNFGYNNSSTFQPSCLNMIDRYSMTIWYWFVCIIILSYLLN